MKNKILNHIDESIRTKQKLREQITVIAKVANTIVQSLKSGGKVILFGNGGSAADAQHIAAELVGKYNIDRKALPAIALTTNSSIVTAVANDFGYENVFLRQLQAICSRKDVVVVISTSGNSKNVIEGARYAKKNKVTVIAMTGKGGGKLASYADLIIKVPSTNVQRIQESHIMIGHILVDLVESELRRIYKNF